MDIWMIINFLIDRSVLWVLFSHPQSLSSYDTPILPPNTQNRKYKIT